MWKLYFKQAWQMMKQQRLFSALYILGTGLAIAMTLVMVLIYYVRIAPIYPEVNRDRTLYIQIISFTKDGSQWQHSASYQAVKEWFYTLENVQAVSASLMDERSDNSYIQPADRSGDFKVKTQFVDPAFFRIYEFSFYDGGPFTEAEWQGGLPVAGITDALAKRLFGTATGVVGRRFSMNFVEYRVGGVVRAASYLTSDSFADVYLPYTVVPGYDQARMPQLTYIGPFDLTFLVKDDAQAEALKQEVSELVRKINLQLGEAGWQVNLYNQPRTHLTKVFQSWVQDEFDAWATARQLLLIVLVLLLVPSLNLSGMIASRMEGRLAEMGVRKSFGASRKVLLKQVMWENLLLTLLGGALGLVLSWLAVYAGRDWVFMMMDDWAILPPAEVEVALSAEMLFAPLVFLAALLVCLFINVLSALLPAWHSLRQPIVKSLNEKL